MGWPYIGETLQLYSQDPNVFFATKQNRYGEIFKTHLLGYPCVMLASPEAARFVLVTQAHLFKPTYPRSKEQLIGPSAPFFHQGEHHTRLRKLVLASLSPEAIQPLVLDIETITTSALESTCDCVINTYHKMKKVSPMPNTFLPHWSACMTWWEVVGSRDGIEHDPFPVPQCGLPARFWKESHSHHTIQ